MTAPSISQSDRETTERQYIITKLKKVGALPAGAPQYHLRHVPATTHLAYRDVDIFGLPYDLLSLLPLVPARTDWLLFNTKAAPPRVCSAIIKKVKKKKKKEAAPLKMAVAQFLCDAASHSTGYLLPLRCMYGGKGGHFTTLHYRSFLARAPDCFFAGQEDRLLGGTPVGWSRWKLDRSGRRYNMSRSIITLRRH